MPEPHMHNGGQERPGRPPRTRRAGQLPVGVLAGPVTMPAWSRPRSQEVSPTLVARQPTPRPGEVIGQFEAQSRNHGLAPIYAFTSGGIAVRTRDPGQSRAPVPVPLTTDRGASMGRQWPLRDFLALGALPGAAASARLHAQHILWEWDKTSLTEPVVQVVSELVTNSSAAARAMQPIQPVRMWLLCDTRTVLVLVWDANPDRPEIREPDDDAEHGRGLLIVQAYSERWGTYPTPQTGGKVVWAQWD